MLKRIVLLALMVTLGAALAAPVLAAVAIQGVVGDIDAGSSANLGTSFGCRVWSNLDPNINANQAVTAPACLNNRCTDPAVIFYDPSMPGGGYYCNQENTGPYHNDAEGQTFTELADAQAFAGACNHTAFYSLQGMIPRTDIPTDNGDPSISGCPSGFFQNCFERADNPDALVVPYTNTNQGYPTAASHTISKVGGMSPVPPVRVSKTALCGSGVQLTWSDPELYSTTNKDGVTTFVKGVRLYENHNPCSQCPNGDAGWVASTSGPTGDGKYALGAGGGTGVCVPVTGDTWYALTVRVKGPNRDTGGGPPAPDPNSEVETGRVGLVGFVGANSQCVNRNATAVRIASMSARYAGRGTVNVNFTTGLEGGVQGYYVARASSPNGPFTRVSGLLNARGVDGSPYAYSDKVRSALGRVLYYSVEIVQTDGTTENSASTAVNLPAGKKKLGH